MVYLCCETDLGRLEQVVHEERDGKEEDPPAYGESPMWVASRHQPTVRKKISKTRREKRRRWTYRVRDRRLLSEHVIVRRTRA
jgi:hypothetical protein